MVYLFVVQSILKKMEIGFTYKIHVDDSKTHINLTLIIVI